MTIVQAGAGRDQRARTSRGVVLVPLKRTFLREEQEHRFDPAVGVLLL
jgi:hypothetical protein